ncbi:MAG: DNA polymerase III subunit delta' [Clostridia bacterium]|nr:DNA polymerase III subunit delta' [Clostridia bacterium]
MSFPLVSNNRIAQVVSKFETKMPHAIIIEGEYGTGKRTLAKYLAKMAVCSGESKPCGSCRDCHLADVGSHPDIEIVSVKDDKKTITVDQIRELKNTVYLSAHTADCRVFIIEKADTMNLNASNSLLKVLEEPPAKTYFILLTESKSALIDTILSRCTTLSLFIPNQEEAFEYIKNTTDFKEEDISKALTLNKNNLGKTLEFLKGAKLSKGITAAERYFSLIEENIILEALKTTVSLEANRLATNDFVNELKEILIKKVKENLSFKESQREYMKMYDVVCDMESLLITNINLSLFFTSLTSRLMSIKN